MDKIMLGNMSSYEQVGFYNNAEKIINIPMGIITALGTVMLPRMSNIVAKGDKEKTSDYIRISIKLVTLLSSAIAFGLMGISNVLSPVFFGEEFTACGDIIKFLSVTVFFIAWANVIRTQYLIPNLFVRIINTFWGDIDAIPKVNISLIILFIILVLADFGILILIDSCCKLNEGTLSMCNDLADLGNNIVSVIALYTASIPVIYNSYDYNNNIENYDEYFRYKRKKYRTDATFSNINGFILEIGICILAFIVALKGYNFFQKYRRKRSALREFLNKDNMKTVLVIMAAGISSRFGGGIKQLAPVGLNSL